jgi:hypothetical protein
VILFIGRNLLIQTQKALPLLDMELLTDQKALKNLQHSCA